MRAASSAASGPSINSRRGLAASARAMGTRWRSSPDSVAGRRCSSGATPSKSITAEPDVDGDEARTLRPLQAAAVTYRVAFGPRAGQKVLTLRGAMPREGTARQPLCADIDGFSLHAAVQVEAHGRKRLEQLCRYITRPALSDERVQLNAAAASGDTS